MSAAGFAQAPWFALVGLAWDASATATGYNLYVGRATNTYLFFVDVGNVLTTVYRIVDKGAWFWAVKAYNAVGESPPSNEVTGVFT